MFCVPNKTMFFKPIICRSPSRLHRRIQTISLFHKQSYFLWSRSYYIALFSIRYRVILKWNQSRIPNWSRFHKKCSFIYFRRAEIILLGYIIFLEICKLAYGYSVLGIIRLGVKLSCHLKKLESLLILSFKQEIL